MNIDRLYQNIQIINTKIERDKHTLGKTHGGGWIICIQTGNGGTVESLMLAQHPTHTSSLREAVKVVQQVLTAKHISSSDPKVNKLVQALNTVVDSHNAKYAHISRFSKLFWGLFGYDYNQITPIPVPTPAVPHLPVPTPAVPHSPLPDVPSTVPLPTDPLKRSSSSQEPIIIPPKLLSSKSIFQIHLPVKAAVPEAIIGSSALPHTSESQITESEVRQHLEHNLIHVFSGGLSVATTVIQDFIHRFGVSNYVNTGTTKSVFSNQEGEIVKIVFSAKNYYSLERSMEEINFLLSNPTISNQPKNITVYLNPADKEAFQQKYKQLMQDHPITIVDMNEPNFLGIVTWTEECYTQSVADVMRQTDASTYLHNIQIIHDFWLGIQKQISAGMEYKVRDLGEVNIGIFQGNRIKIIDAQFSDIPLPMQEVIKNIERYRQILLAHSTRLAGS